MMKSPSGTSTAIRMDHDRARMIGRQLFQRYNIDKVGYLEPKHCYQVYSDYVYRILNIPNQPTLEDAPLMHELLDQNRDKMVNEGDFEQLAIKYLTNIGISSSSINNSTMPSTSNNSNLYTSNVYSLTGPGSNAPYNLSQSQMMPNINTMSSINTSNNIITTTTTTTNFTKRAESMNLESQPVRGQPNKVGTRPQQSSYSPVAIAWLDIIRRQFNLYDRDCSGYLTEDEIPAILTDIYTQIGQNPSSITKADIRNLFKAVDKNGNGKITLDQFEEMVFKSLNRAGIKVYI